MDEASYTANILKAESVSVKPQHTAEGVWNLGALALLCASHGSSLTMFPFHFLNGNDTICFIGLLHYSFVQNILRTYYVPDAYCVPGTKQKSVFL